MPLGATHHSQTGNTQALIFALYVLYYYICTYKNAHGIKIDIKA